MKTYLKNRLLHGMGGGGGGPHPLDVDRLFLFKASCLNRGCGQFWGSWQEESNMKTPLHPILKGKGNRPQADYKLTLL